MQVYVIYEHSRQSSEVGFIWSSLSWHVAYWNLTLIQKADEKIVSVKEGDRIANLEAKSNIAVFYPIST